MITNLIVPVLNRYDLLQRMLNSIDYPIEHLLILDNGASHVEEDIGLNVPPTVDKTTYLPLPSNLGVSGSWNLGIKLFPFADRFFFASNDMWFEPGALETLDVNAKPDELTLVSEFPNWQTFVVGEDVVNRVGLFDEALYPAYFEDKDYERRCLHENVRINLVAAPVGHDNSSTIKSDSRFRFRNSTTFKNNRQYYDLKQRVDDYSQGHWNLVTRRQNDWTDGL